MRLSAEDVSKHNITARVFVDGVEITECFFADEEEGCAQVYVKEDFRKRMTYMPFKTLNGVVKIVINKRQNG